MKKLLAILGLALLMTSVSASTIKICAVEASEVCAEITNRADYQQCHSAIMASCLEDYSNGYKSAPACVKQCSTIPERTQRELCLRTCSPL